jgi:hypothetical protein
VSQFRVLGRTQTLSKRSPQGEEWILGVLVDGSRYGRAANKFKENGGWERVRSEE